MTFRIVYAHVGHERTVLFIVGPKEQFNFQTWARSRHKAMKLLGTTVSCQEYVMSSD